MTAPGRAAQAGKVEEDLIVSSGIAAIRAARTIAVMHTVKPGLTVMIKSSAMSSQVVRKAA